MGSLPSRGGDSPSDDPVTSGMIAAFLLGVVAAAVCIVGQFVPLPAWAVLTWALSLTYGVILTGYLASRQARVSGRPVLRVLTLTAKATVTFFLDATF